MLLGSHQSPTINPLISCGDWAIVNAKDVGKIKAVAIPYKIWNTITYFYEVVFKKGNSVLLWQNILL